MMYLSSKEIRKLCENPGEGEMPLLERYSDENFDGNPAKVELRLGEKCYCSGNASKVIHLDREGYVVIPPNQILMFETYEKINMPVNLSGRMGLKMGLVAKGLIMPSQSTIDPGYSNVLYGMLYNLSSDDITLEYKQRITMLEFAETKVDNGNPYNGAMSDITFEKFVGNRVTSSLGMLAHDVQRANKRLESSTKIWNTIMTCLSVAIAVVAIIVAALSIETSKSKSADIAILERDVNGLRQQIEAQKALLDNYITKNQETNTSPETNSEE